MHSRAEFVESSQSNRGVENFTPSLTVLTSSSSKQVISSSLIVESSFETITYSPHVGFLKSSQVLQAQTRSQASRLLLQLPRQVPPFNDRKSCRGPRLRTNASTWSPAQDRTASTTTPIVRRRHSSRRHVSRGKKRQGANVNHWTSGGASPAHPKWSGRSTQTTSSGTSSRTSPAALPTRRAALQPLRRLGKAKDRPRTTKFGGVRES